VPAGTLRFQVGLAAAADASAERAEPRELRGVRYRRAFVSYASPDRPEVLRRVQAFKIAGMSVFQDILDLGPSERWERALYREIDTCDVFLLFWSRAAASSERVAKEIDYALARKEGDEDRAPDIQPVPIEGPPVVPPPERLRGLQFNNALLAQIRTATPSGPGSPGSSG
jgi:TIR domain-containing protein